MSWSRKCVTLAMSLGRLVAVSLVLLAVACGVAGATSAGAAELSNLRLRGGTGQVCFSLVPPCFVPGPLQLLAQPAADAACTCRADVCTPLNARIRIRKHIIRGVFVGMVSSVRMLLCTTYVVQSVLVSV